MVRVCCLIFKRSGCKGMFMVLGFLVLALRNGIGGLGLCLSNFVFSFFLEIDGDIINFLKR